MRSFGEHRSGQLWMLSVALVSLQLTAAGQTPTRAVDGVSNSEQSAAAIEGSGTAPRPRNDTPKDARVVVSFERLNEEMGRAADVQFGRATEVDTRAAPAAPKSQIKPGPAAASSTLAGSTQPGPEVGAIERQLGMLGVNARRIFGDAGVPVELLAIASVESGLNPRAFSPKGARGLWQFMPATARQYGLRVDLMVDDRLNPNLETQAAARYLRDLRLKFGEWPLALAAYNAGEYRVQAAIDRIGAANYWTLRQTHLLPEETRKYVPAIFSLIGTNRIGAMAGKTGGAMEPSKGIELLATSDNRE